VVKRVSFMIKIGLACRGLCWGLGIVVASATMDDFLL